MLGCTAESNAAIAGQPRAPITRDLPPPALVLEVMSPRQTNRDRDYRSKPAEDTTRSLAEGWITALARRHMTVYQWLNGLLYQYFAQTPLRDF